MAAERKDYKMLVKNTRANLAVDTFVDPNRPITPDTDNRQASGPRISWPPDERVAEERYFHQGEQPNILLEAGQVEDEDEEYYDDDEEGGEEGEPRESEAAPQPPAPQRANSWGGSQIAAETQSITRAGSERQIPASNGNGSNAVAWTAES
eukprot:CAMPEP_0177696554 /NCGR_PEP_ID=MMETSP0484_2-20121128/4041_1 /TAXON_ID=354590 /ORGANISM="Rhodomonas lens, Strain RHODO" /LENGTH=150 /DNA_ID=CAMNT_0019207531 /DNA_START=1 /DNA_END=453 /DNA_ORIENTATION=+